MKHDSQADSVMAFVRQLLPTVVVEPDSKQEPGVCEQSYHIHLPTPPDADYQFTLWFGGGEKQISARLPSDRTAYFWYRPFEEAEFRSTHESSKAFLEVVALIIRHNTRIQQKCGWFFNHFKCEYESESGWKRIYAHSGLRWIRAPKISGRLHTYRSSRLVRDI